MPAQRHLVAKPGESILVVEDDERVRQTLVESLRELGYAAIHVPDAAAAITRLEAGMDVTLLFTDIIMPGRTGKQLADEVKMRWPAIKVLYTTGYSRNAIVHNGVLDPGVQVITKPYTLEQLAAKLREVLDA
jgi:CheY-like chemotaxis protein